MGDDHFDRQRRKIGGQNEIRAPSRCDRSQFALEAEMLGGVEGRHLEGGNRFEALRDRMADDPVHMTLMHQRAGMAVVGAQDEIARIESALGHGLDLARHVVPGRALVSPAPG